MASCGAMIIGSVYRPPLHHHQRSRGHLVCSSSSSSSHRSIPNPICRLSFSRTTTTFNPKLCSGGSRGGGRGRISGGRGGGGGGGGGDDEFNFFRLEPSIGFNYTTFNLVLAWTMATCLSIEYPPFDEEENFFAAMRHMPDLFRLLVAETKNLFTCLVLDPEGIKKLHRQRCFACRRAHAEEQKITSRCAKRK